MPNKNNELLSFTPEGDELIAHYKGCRVSIHTPSRPGHREMQAILTIKEGDASKTTVQYFEGISYVEAAQRVIAWVDQKIKPLLVTALNADISGQSGAELWAATEPHRDYDDNRPPKGREFPESKLWKDDRVIVEQATKSFYDLCRAASLEETVRKKAAQPTYDPEDVLAWAKAELPKCKDCPSKNTCTLSIKTTDKECTAHTDDHERDEKE